MANEDFTPDGYNEPRPKKIWQKSMFWLFTIVGLFIICLLIWMFVALSDNEMDNQIIEQQEQIDNSAQPAEANETVPTDTLGT